MIVPHFYLDPGFDRAADRRRDLAWLDSRLGVAGTRLVPVWRARNLIAGPREAPRAVLLPGDLAGWREIAGVVALLGVAGPAEPEAGTALVAVDVSPLAEPSAHPLLAGRGVFVDLRSSGPLLPHAEGALLAYARGLMWWHSRHRFCGVCGSPTESREAGHQRLCLNPACKAQHFPRTDPAVIVLVHHGDRCLLGRQKNWPAGMHSVLAGFVEPGESLESCVAREVFEESGVRVTDIRYHSSQPWPFPQSLMLGFTARAATTDLRPDLEELEHVGWYQRDWLKAQSATPVGTGAFALPRRDSVARVLVDEWLGQG